jgi:hypothetical protein
MSEALQPTSYDKEKRISIRQASNGYILSADFGTKHYEMVYKTMPQLMKALKLLLETEVVEEETPKTKVGKK